MPVSRCKLCVCVCLHVCAVFLSCQCGLVGPCPVGASLTCSGDKGGRAGTVGLQSVGGSTGSRVEDFANLSAGQWAPGEAGQLRTGPGRGCSPAVPAGMWLQPTLEMSPQPILRVVLLGQHQELRGRRTGGLRHLPSAGGLCDSLFLIGKADMGGAA